jgi:quinoprotein glucose dehydrogenase
MIGNERESASARVEALKALDQLKNPRLDEILQTALKSSEPKLRAEARSISIRRQPEQAVALLQPVFDKGTFIEQQHALSDLASVNRPDADAVLERWLDKLLAGQVPAEARLDLLLAAKQRNNSGMQDRLRKYESARSKTDPLAPWRETLQGGDAENGRNVFLTKAEVSCVKCHKLNGAGGDVGPELAGIGAKQNREYLLESIVLPDAKIAKGFDSVVLELTNGKTVTGVLKSEDDKEVKIITPEAQPLTIAKKDIEERRRGKSAMPEDLHDKLSLREIRDLVEFLAGLKTEHK